MPVEQHVLKALSPLQMPGFDSSSNNISIHPTVICHCLIKVKRTEIYLKMPNLLFA